MMVLRTGGLHVSGSFFWSRGGTLLRLYITRHTLPG
jgi:hypothetical protein